MLWTQTVNKSIIGKAVKGYQFRRRLGPHYSKTTKGIFFYFIILLDSRGCLKLTISWLSLTKGKLWIVRLVAVTFLVGLGMTLLFFCSTGLPVQLSYQHGKDWGKQLVKTSLVYNSTKGRWFGNVWVLLCDSIC